MYFVHSYSGYGSSPYTPGVPSLINLLFPIIIGYYPHKTDGKSLFPARHITIPTFMAWLGGMTLGAGPGPQVGVPLLGSNS